MGVPKLAELQQHYESCKTSNEHVSSVVGTCNDFQEDFEDLFCSYASRMEDACDTQDACRAREVQERSELHVQIKVAEADRKTDHTVASRILCLLSIFEDEHANKSAKLESCMTATPDTSDFDITYLPIPAAANCSKVSSKPCENVWVLGEYTGQDWYNDSGVLPATCSPCPVANPTPSPPVLQPTPSPTTIAHENSNDTFDLKSYDPHGDNVILEKDYLAVPKDSIGYSGAFWMTDTHGFVAHLQHKSAVVRFDLATMRQVDSLDLTSSIGSGQYMSRYVVVNGDWAYFATAEGSPVSYRLNVKSFDSASVEKVDWSMRFPNARVNIVPFQHGGYIYMSNFRCGHPYAREDPRSEGSAYNPDVDTYTEGVCAGFQGGDRRTSGTYGYAVRIPVGNYSADAVETLDLTFPGKCTDGLCGFIRSGFTDDTHGYLIPSFGGWDNKRMRHVLRFRLASFDEPEWFDFNSIMPHDTTFSYQGGFSYGQDAYFVPFDAKYIVKMSADGTKTLIDYLKDFPDENYGTFTRIGATVYMGRYRGWKDVDSVSLLKFTLPSINETEVFSFKYPSNLDKSNNVLYWYGNRMLHTQSAIYQADNSFNIFRHEIQASL